MKKVSILLTILLFCATSLFAQKLSFQAVVRNSANELVPNATLTVAVSVLDASNNVQYSENHTGVQTNQNGLLSLMVGDGTPTSGTTMADVIWSGASIQTVITLPGGATITNTTPINAVPYALSAGNVDPAVIADAIADYLAHHSVGGEDNVQADWEETDPTSDAYVQHKPTDVSAFNNDAGYITKDSIPANVSAFNNDAQYVNNSTCDTIDFCSLAAKFNQLESKIKQQEDMLNTLLANSNIDSIPCPGSPTVKDYDGNIYNTVKIGSQCWMKENLKTTHYSNGTPISLGDDYSATVGYRYYPLDSASYVETYGYLYNWTAVMNGASSSNSVPSGVQGICPVGWHVPSDMEWTQLTNYLSSQSKYLCENNTSYIASALKAMEKWAAYPTFSCSSPNNATGFSALPAGYFRYLFVALGDRAHFYSATQNADDELVWNRTLWYNGGNVARDKYSNVVGLSVRCIRDESISSTSATLPTVTTSSVSNITASSATSGGNVTSDGGDNVTVRGVCWGTTPDPTTSNNHTEDGISTGTFTSSITGLTPNTLYYVRAYAINSMGISYGNNITFFAVRDSIPSGDAQPCPNNPTVSDYDGNIYNTVKIGGQCWMRENLRTTHYSDGTEIPIGTHPNEENGEIYRYTPSDTSMLPMIGYSYTTRAAVRDSSSSDRIPSDIQGICPTGWHLPSPGEWNILVNYVKSVPEYLCGTSIAKAIAAIGGWDDSTEECNQGNNQSTNNATGFSARNGGTRLTSSSYREDVKQGVQFFPPTFWNAYSYVPAKVRCLQNKQPCLGASTVSDTDGNVYNTVQIGDQCWMKENLRTTHYADGTSIPLGDSISYTTPHRYFPNNNSSNTAVYGLLYNWSAVMHGATSSNIIPSRVQGVCPKGWHVPSDAEWNLLTNYVKNQTVFVCGGNSSYIAKALADSTEWNTSTSSCAVGNDLSGNNATGFSGLPAGKYNGIYQFFDDRAIFWGATQSSENKAVLRFLARNNAFVGTTDNPKYESYSVRCLRD